MDPGLDLGSNDGTDFPDSHGVFGGFHLASLLGHRSRDQIGCRDLSRCDFSRRFPMGNPPKFGGIYRDYI